ncbi:MAG: NAD(P)/FAD-dependent oxidoreductase [Desulfobulbaceae bacterium]|nr:NAD(P)/FAD-dependent oxidoreductase [Desulfobulbaceae bacterium]
MSAEIHDVIIVGTGPAGLGAAYELVEARPSLKILMVDKGSICSGGLRNDCKQNYTFPIGFAENYWSKGEAEELLEKVENHLQPKILPTSHLETYQQRAARIGVEIVAVRQAHVGTDQSKKLIHRLLARLEELGVVIRLRTEVSDISETDRDAAIVIDGKEIRGRKLIVAPGRKGFSFLQEIMEKMGITYVDNIVDVGVRLETQQERYPIVADYYDPKIYFPDNVRTFCTNSGHARVIREKYQDFYLINGHALSRQQAGNNLVNVALLKTIHLKDPVRSGQQMAVYLGRLANEIGGGKPLMQRVGDFRMGKRSKEETFNRDLYDFPPTCRVTAGDLGLAVPARIMRHLWTAMKKLDSIVPGILHPSTIMYYPEIKMYANKPVFRDDYCRVTRHLYMIGDGAGTSRGITGA